MHAANLTQQDLVAQLARAEGHLQFDPANPELLALAIDLSLATADLDSASRHAEQARARQPDNLSLQYRYGQVLVAQGKWDEAAQCFTALLNHHVNVNLAYSLANCQLRAGQYGAALESLAPYRDDPALLPQAGALMVRAMHHLGQYQCCADFIESCRARFLGNEDFCAAASLLYLDRGQLEQAEDMAERALAGGAPPVEALVTSATLALLRIDTKLAAMRFTAALARNPAEARSWSGLGMASMLDQNMEGGRAQFEQAVHYMPGHIGSWHALGWCRLLTGDTAGAEQAFSAALALDRNFGESHGAMAVVAAHRGQRALAEVSIKTALRLDPSCLSAGYAQMVLGGQVSDPRRFKEIAMRLIGDRTTPGGERMADVVDRMTPH